MEMLQLYVVYDERLKPVDSNIGSFNRYNHKIDRINIEINEALPEHIFSLNVKRPDGTVNLLGYEVVQVDGTNYYFDVPAWVTEEDGLVEFSLVASTLSQVISFGKFYVDCIDTLQATAQATPDDPTFLSKVDKDLSTYEEVTLTDDTLARVYVDDDGEPSQMSVGALVDKAQQEIPFLSFENPTTHTPLLEGEVAWNETAGTLDIGMKGGNVTQQVGMETYIRVRNDDIVPIVDGNVVYSVGTVGNSGVVRVKLASASDDEISGRVIGCATETIAPNGVGYVTVLGEVNGIDTSLMTPEATLYLGENGAFTETIPTAPTKKIIIGRVMRVAVNGSIYVRLQKGVSLKELDDVVQNGTATGGILVYDSVAGTWGTGDVTFTEADNDLYIGTDLDKIVLNKDTEVNGNLNVKGILTQDGSAYETHLEQLYTEKDHIILRDKAVSGLGVGSYAGLFAKLADGTNNAGLVFDGNGMARVGDIGTNLASPDFSQTQALATREDTPAVGGIPYWNSILKRFDTASGFSYDGSAGSMFVPSEVRTLYVACPSGSNNASVGVITSGTVIYRNIADGNPALRVNLTHASSTGDILRLQHQGIEVASVNKTGVFTGSGLDIDGGILHYGQELFRQVWNISSIDTIYSDITTLPSGQGNGTVLPALTGGALPLKLYEYNSTLAEWVYLVQVRSHTLYTVLATGKIYRYTMSSPYFIEMTNVYDNATSGLTATNYQGAIDEVVEMIGDISTLNEVTITNDDTASIPLTVNAMVGSSVIMQWKYGPTTVATLYGDNTLHLGGGIYAHSINNSYHTNNSKIDLLNTGTVISRNIADTNPALKVNLAHTNATGNIQEWQFGGVNKLEVTKDGWLFQNGTRLLHLTGTNATYLGINAGNTSNTGQNNVGIGSASLASITTGINNVAVGANALSSLNVGTYDTAVGQGALLTTISGTFLTALGWNAGRYIADGTTANATSDYSLYLGGGTKAGADNNQNEIVIGYNAIGKGSNTAVIGNTSLTDVYLGANGTANLYLGAIKNQAIGDIPATINAITGTTANLLSLQVNGVEKAYIDKDGNGKMGKLWLELGTDNIAIGDDALDNLTTGSQNVAIGENAMQFITSGQDNVAIGHDSSLINQTGNNNVSVGYGSLYQNQTNNNTALGYSALGQITTGGDNVGVGYRAGVYYAGGVYLNSTGSQGVFLGADTKASANGNSNEIVIGYNALGNGSNTATIGNSSLTDVYFGDGTATLHSLVAYDNTTSGLTATSVQDAIDELAASGGGYIEVYDVVVNNWTADTTYAGYGYRGTITIAGATSDDIPDVFLSPTEQDSGNYYHICESTTDGIYIYSKVNTSITVVRAKADIR